MAFSNNLSDAELERLALLAEECGEVLQVIGKIIRHGYQSSNPHFPSDQGGPTNRDLLVKEVGDVLLAIDFLMRHDIAEEQIEDRMRVKRHRVYDYLHHQS
jgi:NTP pyrophosphatase (non-canonical NTP hydrolase)